MIRMTNALIAAGLAALALFGAGNAAAAPGLDEDGFLDAVHAEGFTNRYGDAGHLRNGRITCSLYRLGWSDEAVINKIAEQNPAMGASTTQFVVLSLAYLCP